MIHGSSWDDETSSGPLASIRYHQDAKLIRPWDRLSRASKRSGRLLPAIASEASFRQPVTAAIDVTTVPYSGGADGLSMVSRVQGDEEPVFDARHSRPSARPPLVVAVAPIQENLAWERNPPTPVHRVVRRLGRRANGLRGNAIVEASPPDASAAGRA